MLGRGPGGYEWSKQIRRLLAGGWMVVGWWLVAPRPVVSGAGVGGVGAGAGAGGGGGGGMVVVVGRGRVAHARLPS